MGKLLLEIRNTVNIYSFEVTGISFTLLCPLPDTYRINKIYPPLIIDPWNVSQTQGRTIQLEKNIFWDLIIRKYGYLKNYIFCMIKIIGNPLTSSFSNPWFVLSETNSYWAKIIFARKLRNPYFCHIFLYGKAIFFEKRACISLG